MHFQRTYQRLAAAVLALASTPAAGNQDSDPEATIEALSEHLRRLEAEQAELKAQIERLQRATQEQPESETAARTRPAEATSEQVTSGRAFNPAISVILDGVFYQDDIDGDGEALLGQALRPSHSHGHDGHDHSHGAIDPGFNLRETEIAFSAAVDPYFNAEAYLAVSEEAVELEEAFLQTRALPGGLRLKAGKFLSDIGYINDQHPHQWDFVDQNLAYRNLLGDHGLLDTGVQLTWLPRLPVYTRLGIEVLQGDQGRFGALVDDEAEREAAGLDDPEDGPRLFTGFLKLAPDLGYSHALQLGAWYAHNQQHQERHTSPVSHALEGDADLWGLDLVYKYDSPEAYGLGDWVLQTEYLRESKDLSITAHTGDPGLVGDSRDFLTDAWYAQARYGFAPRWQAALRYAAVGLTNEVSGDAEANFGHSDRWSAALTFMPTEFSRLRLQYTRADILTAPGEHRRFNGVYAQYLMSLGSHGAHEF